MKILNSDNAALVIVDVQEAFEKAIPGYSVLVDQITAAAKGFGLLGCPVVVTEQYPQGLGRTSSLILESVPEDTPVIEKTTFSSCGVDSFKLALEGVTQVAVCGIEAHICVNQTVHGLLQGGFSVHVLEDAVASRSAENKETALRKFVTSGAIPSSVEMALFEMVTDSASDKFKSIQNLIK